MIEMLESRVEKGDPKAMVILSKMHREGLCGLPRDEAKALELMRRSADLGFPEAIRRLGYYVMVGELGAIQDKEKAKLYMEDAAKRGDVCARYYLGEIGEFYQQHELALKHYKLAAAAGDEDAMKRVWKYFPSDKLTKAELEETLRAHHAACEEMNSVDRERYEAYKEAMAGSDIILKDIYALYYDGLMDAKELKKKLKAYRNEE